MSFGVPTVPTSGTVSVGAAATTTGSITVDSTACYLVCVTARHATVAFTDTTTVSGMSLTWTKLSNVQQNSGLEQMTVFAGYGTGGTTGTLTITLSQTAASGRYVVIVIPGARRSTNPYTGTADSATGTGTTGTVNLGTQHGGSWRFGFWSHAAAELVTPDTTGATWAELHDQSTTSIALEVQYTSGGDYTHTATWATSSRWMGIVIELDNYAGYYAALSKDETPLGAAPMTYIMPEGDEAAWAIIGC